MMVSDLQPGDGLIYTGRELFDQIEKVKLGSEATHFEVYIGYGYTITSKFKTGVGVYKANLYGLLRVIRPVARLNWAEAVERFKATVCGLPYGFEALLNFANVQVPDRGLFCSEVGTLLYRAAGLDPFNATIHAARVAPMHFLYLSETLFSIPFQL